MYRRKDICFDCYRSHLVKRTSVCPYTLFKDHFANHTLFVLFKYPSNKLFISFFALFFQCFKNGTADFFKLGRTFGFCHMGDGSLYCFSIVFCNIRIKCLVNFEIVQFQCNRLPHHRFKLRGIHFTRLFNSILRQPYRFNKCLFINFVAFLMLQNQRCCTQHRINRIDLNIIDHF